MTAIADLLNAAQRVEAENAALREALAFYAEPANWRREVRNVGPRINWWSPAAARDKGGMARMVLMGLEASREQLQRNDR